MENISTPENISYKRNPMKARQICKKERGEEEEPCMEQWRGLYYSYTVLVQLFSDFLICDP